MPTKAELKETITHLIENSEKSQHEKNTLLKQINNYTNKKDLKTFFDQLQSSEEPILEDEDQEPHQEDPIKPSKKKSESISDIPRKCNQCNFITRDQKLKKCTKCGHDKFSSWP